MATGFYVPDGRDFSSIFTAGNAGFTSGFKQANGQDLGNIFQAGNLNLVTGYKISNNIDMGNKLGATVAWSNNANTCQVLDKEDGTEVTNTNLKNAALGIYSSYTDSFIGFFLGFYRTVVITSVRVITSRAEEVRVLLKSTEDIFVMNNKHASNDEQWTGNVSNCTGLRVGVYGEFNFDGTLSDCTLNQFIVSGHY